MNKKPIIQVIVSALLIVAAYFVGFKLGQGQAHQRIADAWNEMFGEAIAAEATEMLTDDIQGPFRQSPFGDDPFGEDPFGEDPFGPTNANDPFATNLGPFLGNDASGNGNDLLNLLETNSTK